MLLPIPIFVLFALWTGPGSAAPAATASSSVKRGKAVSTSKAATASKTTAAASDPTAGKPGGATNGVSDKQVANAVTSWMNDTAKVTKFLNTATSFTGDEFTRQATIALNAEIDELNHKTILDAAFGQMAMIQAANDTLATQGTFQAVVDTLQSMVDSGPDTAQAQVDVINKNRCVNVLPNIDMYFAAAGSASIQAVRPTGCLEIEAASASTPAGAQAPPQAEGADGGSPTTGSLSNGTTSSKAAAKTTSKAGVSAAANAAPSVTKVSSPKTSGALPKTSVSKPAVSAASKAGASATSEEAPAAVETPAPDAETGPAETSISKAAGSAPKPSITKVAGSVTAKASVGAISKLGASGSKASTSKAKVASTSAK